MGRYDSLFVKPFTRATSAWANAIVSALNDLDERTQNLDLEHLKTDIIPEYDLAYDIGDPTHRFYAYYGYLGFFDGDLFVQGKRVIKDEDPINIYDIFQPAQDKLVEAFYDALSKGIIIVGPTDPYGNVRVSIENAFRPVSTSISVSAAENTSGVELSLIVDGRPNVNIAYSTDTIMTVIVEFSNDGVNWFTRYDNTVSDNGIISFNDNAMKWVRVRVPNTGINVYLEISASR